MKPMRIRGVALCLLVGLVLLGGCIRMPWSSPPMLPVLENLLENGDAENNGVGWHFSSGDAIVDSSYGNPSFAIRNDASIRQTVDIRTIAGNYAVLMAITAAETIGSTGMGTVHGTFLDGNDPQLVIGSLMSNDLISTAAIPLQLVMLTDYVIIPSGTAEISIFLENTEVAGVPHDGAITWFDDVELWIVETEQDAIDRINTYKARYMP